MSDLFYEEDLAFHRALVEAHHKPRTTHMKQVTKVSELRKYLREMILVPRTSESYPRIQHAPKVDDAVLNVVGRLVMYADDDSIYIGERRKSNGLLNQVNMIWFTVAQRPYAIVYSNGQIQIRARTRHGNTVGAFDNQTNSPAHLDRVFASL